MSHQRRVYVVGHDVETRRLLSQHVGACGAEAWPFASAADFLEIVGHLAPACVLLDMDMPDVSGLDVLEQMMGQQVDWPVIAYSAGAEFHLVIGAMKLGALDFLRLPLAREALAPALAPAWKALEASVERSEARRSAQERLSRLTAREMDVLIALLGGRSNKRIAHDFGISVRTVEMHRAHTMSKLVVKGLAEAALLATQAGLDLGVPATSTPSKPRDPRLQPGLLPTGGCRGELSALARRLSSGAVSG
jgi:two-component system, LuxR family, response regulator FixJ